MERHQPHVLPKSPIGTTLHYTPNQWTQLVDLLQDGRYDPDNNAVE
ncbi:MAG: transposase [Candidatus Competibacterales bacterium]